jgi:hypothetical protein
LIRTASSGTHSGNTKRITVPLRKTAIALPEDVLEGIDRAARERGESRSRFIARVLRAALRSRRDSDITRRLDALFADASVAAQQIRGAQDLDAAGAEWNDERW